MLPLLLAVFLITFAVFVAAMMLGLGYFKQKQRRQIKFMLRKAEEAPTRQKDSDFVRPADEEGALAALLSRFKVIERVDLILEQSGIGWTSSKLVMFCGVCAAIGFFLGARFNFGINPEMTGLIGAGSLGCLPVLWIMKKRSKAIADFGKQFPDALDFLSRSMRAGHAFSVALEMLGADAPEPLGKAFRRVSNDLALGSNLEEAFGKLRTMVPTVDVQFFISSVLLQQETGGNLGEILTKLAHIIRERFQLKGQVQAVSAHGRITGLVLLFMPLGVVVFLTLTNPGYLHSLFDDPTGRMMVYGAIAAQAIGYFVIQKIIDIKV